MKRRSGKRGGFLGKAALLLGGALLVGLGVRCRPDLLLKNQAASHGKGDLPGTSTGETEHPPSKAPSKKAENSPPAQGTAPGPGPTESSIHLAMGTPYDSDPADDTLLIKPQYALSYNPRLNVPNWVSSNLNETYFGDAPRRKGKFIPDETLPAGFYRVRDQDYTGSGYDRGHMVRSEERTRTPEDNTSTFLLTNVLPQRHDMNAGPWLRLEDYCQELSQKGHKELYIVTGGVFHNPPDTIGKGVAVPDSCFKIVVVMERGEKAKDVTEATRVIAVVMPNITGILDEPWGQYRTSVKEVERLSGYRFLPAVSEAAQRTIKTRTDNGPTSGH
jgi:endonuclease G, mitochondrial